MFKAICIDNSNRPRRISPTEWLEEGRTYTIVEVARMNLQNNKIGYRLKEVQLTDQSFPYEYYSAERFLPIDALVQVAEKLKSEEVPADLELV